VFLPLAGRPQAQCDPADVGEEPEIGIDETAAAPDVAGAAVDVGAVTGGLAAESPASVADAIAVAGV
jgi:hypothetical protein